MGRRGWSWPLLVALALAGCGGGSTAVKLQIPGSHATIYSSLPLEGFEAVAARQIARGEQLALAQAHGRAGKLQLSLVLLNDANPQTGQWEPGLAATNARLATEDSDSIAYIGDLNSGATAVALPLTNAASLLQISPGSPYVGLTSTLDAGQDDPQRFYPSGRVTFLRLVPADPVEARADLAFLQARGIRSVYVISDEDPFYISLAELFAQAATQAGLTVPAYDRIHIGSADEPSEYKGEAQRVAASGAQAVLFSGPPEGGSVALLRELHEADPQLLLVGCHALANPRFAARLGPAAARTFLSTPYLPPASYQPKARALFASYQAAFHEQPQVYALYGYEAMELVLAAIRKAGKQAHNRQALAAALFKLGSRDGVIGRYSILADGETTLDRYELDDVVHGVPEPFRLVEVGSGQATVRSPQPLRRRKRPG